MDDRDLELIILGQTPLIVLETFDEARAINLLTKHGRKLFAGGSRWSLTDGLAPLGFGLIPKNPDELKSAESVLEHIKSQSSNHLFVLCDIHPFIDEPRVIRLIKDIALNANAFDQKLVLLSHELILPPELSRLSAKVSLTLPCDQEVRNIVRGEAKRWQNSNQGQKVKADPTILTRLVNNLLGLSHQEVKRLAYAAIADDGAISEEDLPELSKAKFALMDMDGVLHFDYSAERMTNVAGLDNLKSWLEDRHSAMQNPSLSDKPKGVLLFGVQGAGKSLAAKCIAGQWGLPLLRLDFAALYNKYIGETEKNLRDALKLADLMAPCVLWVDEIEKGLSEDTDQGVGKRILGTLLTWMSDRKSDVFMVATSNDVSQLAPELLRKGRFDELFFVDLPNFEVRKAIFSLHLQKRDVMPSVIDLKVLSELAEGFSGAEIEQVVVSAMYSSAALNQSLDQGALILALNQTQPLSVLRAESIASLRSWANERAVTA